MCAGTFGIEGYNDGYLKGNTGCLDPQKATLTIRLSIKTSDSSIVYRYKSCASKLFGSSAASCKF